MRKRGFYKKESKNNNENKTTFTGTINGDDIKIKADYSDNHYLIEVDEIVIGAIDTLDDQKRDSYRIEINDFAVTVAKTALWIAESQMMKETEEIRCIEPDYIFILQPKRDRRKDPCYTYIRPGYEIADIYMEWKIYFWNEGLTDNFLSIRFDRTEITAFRDYLKSVISVAEE